MSLVHKGINNHVIEYLDYYCGLEDAPEDWKLVSYGITSRYLQKLTQKQGVDVMLQKTTKDSSQSYTVATFELLPNSSLKEIK